MKSAEMLTGAQPCFQLLRIGLSTGDSARDLYTFRPALNHSVFRLGRAAELCDVTLESALVSRIHAELHAEKEAGDADGEQQEEGWRVHIKDRSSHGEEARVSHTSYEGSVHTSHFGSETRRLRGNLSTSERKEANQRR